MSRGMTENLEALPARVDRIEQKLDSLVASVDDRFDRVDTRFTEIDQRFDDVSEAIVEQRQYTEFAFARLERAMHGEFAAVRTDIERVRVAAADQFEQLHGKLERAATVDQVRELSERLDRAATVDQVRELAERLERAIARGPRRRRTRPKAKKR